MSRDHMKDVEFSEMCLKLPRTPIEDDSSYQAALKILDRLFARDDLRTPAELEYFRTLAQMASEYEMKHTRNSSP